MRFFADLTSRRHGATQLHPLTEVAVTAFVLGALLTLSAALVAGYALLGWPVSCLAVGAYLFVTTVMFHMTEFVVAAQYRPHDATPRSFMIFHSVAFLYATAAGGAQHERCGAVDRPSKPALTPYGVLFGVLLSVGFYAVRAVSMVQCANNFSLIVEHRKRKEHQLVTTGLYTHLRHPSYFGWFWYAVSTQVVAGNPVCLVLFAGASWFFFNERIQYEEAVMLDDGFFGDEYVQYRKRTFIGIPFIKTK
jgi:protein-S-isoprenylcysteine O-methyltransferase